MPHRRLAIQRAHWAADLLARNLALRVAASGIGHRQGKNARRLLRLPASGVIKEAPTPADKGQLELYELTLKPGASSGTDFLQHTGEKAGYIL